MKKSAMTAEKWRKQNRDKVYKLTLKGDYKAALAIVRKGFNLFPNDFSCRFQYARLLGDAADELPKSQRLKCKKEAIKILKPLTRSMSGMAPDKRFSVCLNYYYQSEKFKEMFTYGLRLAKRGERHGYYAQGLGACLHAQKLQRAGRSALARAWAKKSVAAWKRYNLRSEKYYFARYSYALALALFGDQKAAFASLKTAARLGKRPVTDWEFADVLELIKSMQHL